jgi:hypothetical protein
MTTNSDCHQPNNTAADLMSSLRAEGHLVAKSFEKSSKRAMEIYIKTAKKMRKSRGPVTMAEKHQLRMLRDYFGTLFPSLSAATWSYPIQVYTQ